MAKLEWKRLDKTEVTKVGWRTITTKYFELPNGKVAKYDTTNSDGWQGATVLALTSDNKVIVARQFRPGPERLMDELPGGLVEKGEDKEVAVRRELLEETGYEAGEITFLGTMYYDSYFNGHRHCFLATNCKLSESGPAPDEREFIEVRLITIDELLDNARQGKLTDPGVVLLAYEELQQRRSL